MVTARAGRVSVSLVAGPLHITGSAEGTIGAQLIMDGLTPGSYLYVTPEVAEQWLPVIQQIAGEKK